MYVWKESESECRKENGDGFSKEGRIVMQGNFGCTAYGACFWSLSNWGLSLMNKKQMKQLQESGVRVKLQVNA